MPLYTLKILTDFASAHTLRGYPGACARMHGHNWKVEVEVQAQQLDELGIAIDFKTIRRETNAICDRLDHHYLNDIEPFTEINPTAENIAAYLFNAIATVINNERVRVSAVTLWETDRACVRYTE
ncbi:MAG: 6-carboxytetrahydropterin synthase QueD [Gammaproteobacteria bacterium]|nr:6-carboxytetrahydropterin synthase QueD [Gammaproteobacteria bacterium]